MHPHIELLIANDRIADRVSSAERERTARGGRPSRRRVRFSFRSLLPRRPAFATA